MKNHKVHLQYRRKLEGKYKEANLFVLLLVKRMFSRGAWTIAIGGADKPSRS